MMKPSPPSRDATSKIASDTRADRLVPRLRKRLLATLLLHFAANSLLTQPYVLDWHTTHPGGANSTGGDYVLSGTIGQTDAAVYSSADYRVEGGFWPGLIVPSTADAPTLVVQVRENNLRISWSPATSGFRLEQTSDLSVPDWITAPAGNPATIPLSEQARFYRLNRL